MNIRKTEKDDIAYILELEAVPENTQFIIPWSLEQHQKAINDPNIYHAVAEFHSERVGFFILSGISDDNASIEFMRVVIGKKNQGFGRNILKKVKVIAFDQLKANRLWLDVKTNNERAFNLYKSENFSLEGTLREALKTKNGFDSLHILSILKSEYNS